MSGNIGMPASNKGTLQFNINYDLNNLQTFKDGRNTVNDRTRERQTHSVLFEFGYSITERLSVDGFFSFVRQERDIETRPNERDFTYTQGIGDAVFLLKYRILKPLTIGYGVKAPLGSSDRTSDGLSLTADLQPGSGAWDNLLYANYSQQFNFRPSLSYFGTVIYRITGENDQYLESSRYEFGNETQLIAGVSDRFNIGTKMFDPALRFRYRHAERDQFDGFGFPGSGGRFLFINPGVTWVISDRFSYQFNFELPLYADVNEVQLSPSFRINTGIYISFGKRKIEFKL